MNEQLNSDRVTKRNPYLSNVAITLINPHLQDQRELQPGNILCDRYLLGERLEVAAGEAELFFCTDTQADVSQRLVAKLYRRNAAFRSNVIDLVATVDSPYVGKSIATGQWNGRAYEIIPYYENGSLQGRTCSYEELKTVIIPCLNEALGALHGAGVIHKDLKPSNIMRKADGSVAIIDFGVSAEIEDGLTMLVDQTGRTLAYSAPETFRDVFLRESDYYSLGITIFELFAGKLPYAGLSDAELERLVSVQKLPLPEEMPIALQELIMGLTYGDISNRQDKTNPNRRWTYEEVARWLAGEKLPIPGKGGGLLESCPYAFRGEFYEDLELLTDALARNWEAGKDELFRGNMTAHFRRVSNSIVEICSKAEEKAAIGDGRDDEIFWETLYQLAPECRRLYWRGVFWENLPALGRDILEAKSSDAEQVRQLAGEMFGQGIIAKYLRRFDAGALAKQQKLINELSVLYNTAYDVHERKKYIFELGYVLSGQLVLYVDDREFYNVRQLREYLQEQCGVSIKELQKICRKLLDDQQRLAPHFEVWLLALGKGPEVRKWKKELGFIQEEQP